MDTLSSGVIASIIDGEHPENPVLQILSMKRIPSANQQRWRLLLSDGKLSSSFAMLATQLNSKVETGEITNNCIISLDRYVCNTVQENKKVLIILDLSVVKTGAEVGVKLGNPMQYDSRQQQQQQQNMSAPPKAPFNTAATAGGIQRTPLAQHNPQSGGPAPQPLVDKTPAGGAVHPIDSLTPYQNKWTICARVTNKSAIRTWSNPRGEGKLFSMDLLDESGEIRATAFKELVDKYYDMIEIGKVYFISNASLKTANKQYCNLKNDYEMTFHRGTEVIPCQEDTAIPAMQFNFVSIDQIETLPKDTIVDVIGVCKESCELANITSKSTGKELVKRDIQLVDTTAREVRLTLWGTYAETFDGTQQPVVAVKGAKVTEFNGVSLSTLSSSCLQINPDIREAHMLKGWYDNGGNQAETLNISGKGAGQGGGVSGEFKMLAEVQQGTGGEKAEYCCIKATVVTVRKESCLYMGCPNEGCNKKVTDLSNGEYRCEKCDRSSPSFNWRIILGVCVSDISGSNWVTIFQEVAEQMLNTTSDELGALKDNDKDEFDRILDSIIFKNYELKLRCKMETYNGESRWKINVIGFSPTDPKLLGRRLLNEIKKMQEVM